MTYPATQLRIHGRAALPWGRTRASRQPIETGAGSAPATPAAASAPAITEPKKVEKTSEVPSPSSLIFLYVFALFASLPLPLRRVI